MTNPIRFILSIGLIGTIAACGETNPTTPQSSDVIGTDATFAVSVGDGVVGPEEFELCKIGGPAAGTVFNIDVRDRITNAPITNFDVTLNDGDCLVVWTRGGGDDIVTVQETIPAGFNTPTWVLQQLENSTITVTSGAGTTVYGVLGGVLGDEIAQGALLTYTNTPGEINGRMTGGGKQVRIDVVRITRGFTIHCDILLSNNIEVNWPGNKWHLDKPITMATCIDDPQFDEGQPPAPFNTFIGEGFGRLNGTSGSFIRYVFIDNGEPGSGNDRASIDIWAPGANPGVDTPVLSVAGVLDHGNIQAHFDQPHKK